MTYIYKEEVSRKYIMHNVVTLYLLDKIKNPPVSAGDLRGMDLIPWFGQEDPLEEGMATHSRIVA